MTLSNLAAPVTAPPSVIYDTIRRLILMQEATMLWGPPGIGKSDLLRRIAEDEDFIFIDIRASTMAPEDMLGIPYREGKITYWATPAFLPPTDSDLKYLIVFEELPTATEAVQSTLYQIILDRKHGMYDLPKNASVVATGNRRDDQGVFHPYADALKDRFWNLELKPDIREWLQWAYENDVADEVRGYISIKPEALSRADPDNDDEYMLRDEHRSFTTPRSWTKVSKYLTEYGRPESQVEYVLYSGKIGPEAASDFIAFLDQWRDLVHPRTIIDDPENAPIPENTSALIATCSSLYRLADDTNFSAIVKYAQRLPRPEVRAFLVDSCVNRDSTLRDTPHWIAYAATNP